MNHSHHYKLYITTFCVGALLAACNPAKNQTNTNNPEQPSIPDAGPLPPKPPVVVIDNLADLLAPPICQLLERCYGEVFSEKLGLSSRCEPEYQLVLANDWLPKIKKAVDRGTIRFSSDQVSAQVAYLTNLGCDQVSDRALLLDQIFEGLVSNGGACEIDDECANSSFCKIGSQCPGVCTPRVTAASGETCKADNECELGASCSLGSKTCKRMAKEGEACSETSRCSGLTECDETCKSFKVLTESRAVPEDGDCNKGPLVFCDKGLSCVRTSAAEYRCRPRAQTLQPCAFSDLDYSCAQEDYCDAVEVAGGVGMGTCRKRGEAGEACNEKALSPFARGGSCRIGLICSSQSQTCVVPKKNGASCGSSEECQSTECTGGICTTSELTCGD